MFEERQKILKISTQDGGFGVVTLKIEGRIVGEWASELDRTWASLMPSLDAKKLCIDICGVLYVDESGRQTLRKIVETTGAEILADSPLTKQFANEAKAKPRKKNREGL